MQARSRTDRTIILSRWSSDFPLLDLDRAVRDARALDLTTEQLERFLYANADELLWQRS